MRWGENCQRVSDFILIKRLFLTFNPMMFFFNSDLQLCSNSQNVVGIFAIFYASFTFSHCSGVKYITALEYGKRAKTGLSGWQTNYLKALPDLIGSFLISEQENKDFR